MDKLEDYLDQVCRRIGGPRSMRQHIRQELAEHLRDAAAQYRAVGLSDDEALARALEDFGKPQDVRSELEATHGQRLLAVAIDKAIEWKEMTMKAKWLWASWAYLAVAGVIALEVLFITFNMVFIVPKFKKLMHDGIIDPTIVEDAGASWMTAFLDRLSYLTGHYTTFILLAAVVAWGVFEWRVRSDNKPLIRLAALGSAAVGLMALVAVMAGSLVICFCLGVPATGRLARPFALDQVAHIDSSVNVLERSLPKRDWEAMRDDVTQAIVSLDNLVKSAPAVYALESWLGQPAAGELRGRMKAASDNLLDARRAIAEHDTVHLDAALQLFRKSFEPIQEAAKKAPK
jgi:hypothetical protein